MLKLSLKWFRDKKLMSVPDEITKLIDNSGNNFHAKLLVGSLMMVGTLQSVPTTWINLKARRAK